MSTSSLISAIELSALLALPNAQQDLLLLDCRFDLTQPEAGQLAWDAGHIPTAQYVHLDRDLAAPKTGLNGRHPLPSRETFAATMGQLGLRPSTRVIAYDAHGGMFAARAWWMLRWLGHAHVQILDGGLPAWQRVGGAIETTHTAPQIAPPYPPAPTPAMPTISAEALREALESGRYTLIDARSPDRFRGENETLDPVGGHIPGALNHFFKDNLSLDGTFLPADVLKSAFEQVLANKPNTQVVQQCGSGVTACHNLFAMHLAGLPLSTLYPGSWSEWCTQPHYPMATGT